MSTSNITIYKLLEDKTCLKHLLLHVYQAFALKTLHVSGICELCLFTIQCDQGINLLFTQTFLTWQSFPSYLYVPCPSWILLHSQHTSHHKKYACPKLASVAQLDVRLTGDQEVEGFDPCRVGNILSWRLRNIFYGHSLSLFGWFKKGSCQFLVKECAQYWLTA